MPPSSIVNSILHRAMQPGLEQQ